MRWLPAGLLVSILANVIVLGLLLDTRKDVTDLRDEQRDTAGAFLSGTQAGLDRSRNDLGDISGRVDDLESLVGDDRDLLAELQSNVSDLETRIDDIEILLTVEHQDLFDSITRDLRDLQSRIDELEFQVSLLCDELGIRC